MLNIITIKIYSHFFMFETKMYPSFVSLSYTLSIDSSIFFSYITMNFFSFIRWELGEDDFFSVFQEHLYFTFYKSIQASIFFLKVIIYFKMKVNVLPKFFWKYEFEYMSEVIKVFSMGSYDKMWIRCFYDNSIDFTLFLNYIYTFIIDSKMIKEITTYIL